MAGECLTDKGDQMRVNHTSQKKRPRRGAYTMVKPLSELTKELKALSEDLTTDPLYGTMQGDDETTMGEIMFEAREEREEDD